MLLVTLAVSLPVAATCAVLGLQLNRQARDLFTANLHAGLETFALLIQGSERNLVDGVRRSAADNTLQVTLELRNSPQLTAYIEAQRQVLGIDVLAAYDSDGLMVASAHAGGRSGPRWQIVPRDAVSEPCSATRDVEQQIAMCGGAPFLVSVFPIARGREGLSGAAANDAAQVGFLLGAMPLPPRWLLTSLEQRKVGRILIWADHGLVYSTLDRRVARDVIPDAEVRQYELGGIAYLAAARSVPFGPHVLSLGLLAPLAPLQRALLESLLAVAAIGALVIAGALIMLFVLASRMLRPIRRLQEGAARIGEGELSHRIAVKTGDEMEALAAQFNHMAESLQESYSDLEAKIEDRTRALKESMLQLEEKSQQLELASQHKSQFVANMSHELRTPLAAILGYAELMQEGFHGDLPEKAKSTLGRVQANGKHLLGLINSVLDISKIEAGQFTLNLAEYALDDMIETVCVATESLAAAKKIALVADVPSGLPRGLGDEQRLTQVVLNLVGNAIKFTDTGEVRIVASAEGGRFAISVKDTGPGIPPEEQERIFEEFHQIDNSNTRTKGGTGLGLAIAKKIVEMHGGRISVESKLGEGATFRVDLPVRVEVQRLS